MILTWSQHVNKVGTMIYHINMPQKLSVSFKFQIQPFCFNFYVNFEGTILLIHVPKLLNCYT